MRLFGFLIGLIGFGAVVGLAAAGCDGKCSGTFNCPAGTPFDRLSAADLPSALVEVSADAPCTATLAVSGDGGAASVDVEDNASNETLTCHLHGRLADGRTVTATVSFQAATISCCPGYLAGGGDFVLTDAGTDGPLSD
jgi:hypothetical protein